MSTVIEKVHRNTAILGPYEGYIGEVDIDENAGILFGRVIGLKDMITFQGRTVDKAVQSFHESVDDYLAYCKELGEKPEKPFSGNISFRTRPEVHSMISTAAQLARVSINAWMEEILTKAAQRTIEAATTARDRTYQESSAAEPTTVGPHSAAQKPEETDFVVRAPYRGSAT